MAEPVKVRIVTPHQHVGDIPDYHEWIPRGRVRCNSRGVSNPRMTFASWTKWVCNNLDCGAFAYVSDDAVRELIEGCGE